VWEILELKKIKLNFLKEKKVKFDKFIKNSNSVLMRNVIMRVGLI